MERKSRPFAKFIVSTLVRRNDGGTENASTCGNEKFRLTFWGVTDDAFNEMAESHSLQIKGATLKSVSSMLEINVNGRSEIDYLGKIPSDELALSGFSPRAPFRKISDFPKSNCSNGSSSMTRGSIMKATEIDVIGTVENTGATMNNICLVYITVEGGKKVRLERECSAENNLEKWKLKNVSAGKFWLIQNVDLTGWDEFEGCPIVRWVGHSTCSSVAAGR